MTVLEDGRLLAIARDKRFRKRLFNGEDEHVEFDGWTTGDGIQVEWVMLPGRVYTFNVGGWAFCEALSGDGLGSFSYAYPRLDGQVIALTAFFTD